MQFDGFTQQRYSIEMPPGRNHTPELKPDLERGEDVLEVSCGDLRAFLYVHKLCQGSKGKSILFNENWITPNEFQKQGGRVSAKDWKRSIRHGAKSLKVLISRGLIKLHQNDCRCDNCIQAGAHFYNEVSIFAAAAVP